MQLEQFKGLVSEHKDRLFRLANWMLHNPEDAEDLVQEVFIKVWSMRADMKKYRSVEGLLVQMTKNMAINKIKSKKIDGSDSMLLTVASGSSQPDKVIEDKEHVSLVRKAISQLPEIQQTILQMRAVEGMETKKIAELIGETENNVRVILSRARKSLKTQLKTSMNYG